ncbi:hypothetical protein [Clostridium thermopalmarium]|nr:hypothetical protein [Clostridium thermopalmarium]
MYTIAKECPNSIILPGFSAQGTVSSTEVMNWLKNNQKQLKINKEL